MAYIIHKSDGTVVTVPDNAIDIAFYDSNHSGTGLGLGVQLVGRNTIDYGAAIAQNFLQLTENFACTSQPIDATSLLGQTWFNLTTKTLNVKTDVNTWVGLLGPGSALGTPISGNLVNGTGYLASNLSGTVSIANGGTGQTTANTALNAFLPTQTSNSGKLLTTDGTNASWGGTLSIANGGTGQTTANTALNAFLPTQTSNSGKLLTTDGTNTSWTTIAPDASSVSYLPGGTGATVTTVQAELRRTVYVTDFVDAAALGTAGPHIPNPDWTSAIQAAVNYAQITVPTDLTRPCAIVFPHGLYDCYGTVAIAGAVNFVGEGSPSSITGARIRVQGTSHQLFTISSAVGSSVCFNQMLFIGNGSTPVTDQGIIETTGTGMAANSLYFRNCWFSYANYYAINIQNTADDIVITGCTFDVMPSHCIRLGSGSSYADHVCITDNTFYGGTPSGSGSTTSFVDIDNAVDVLINDNRFYTGPGNAGLVAIQTLSANPTQIVISNNTCETFSHFANISCNEVTITGNTVKGGHSTIILSGGGTLNGIVITGNNLDGNGDTLGVIDATGTLVSNSVITSNRIEGHSCAFGLNLNASCFTAGGNVIRDNSVHATAVDGANGVFPWVPILYDLGNTGVFTYTSHTGHYVIADGYITLNYTIQVASITTPVTGEIVILTTPLPGGTDTARGSVFLDHVTFPAGTTMAVASIDATTNYVRTLFCGSGIAYAALGTTNVVTNSIISGSITYPY